MLIRKYYSSCAAAMLILYALLMSISCSNDNIAGGNSSETTNAKIYACNGLPAASAKVRLIDAQNWTYLVSRNNSPVLDSSITDENGNVTFDKLPAELCNLQIDHDCSGIVIRNFSNYGKVIGKSDSIKLLKYATVQGSCTSTDTSLNTVQFEGTVYSAPVNTTKQFTLSKIAPGKYPFIFRSASGAFDIINAKTLSESQVLTVDKIPVDFTQYVIDDFEDGDSITIPGQITGAYWYGFYDGLSSLTKTICNCGEEHGYVLSASITLQPNICGSWGGIGAFLDNKHTEWDLSSISSISFKAKGSGTFRVSIESAKIDSISTWPHFGFIFSPDSNWTTYEIPVDSLALVKNTTVYKSGITWAEAAKRIVRIEFETSSTYSALGDHELAIDDITLHGITDTEFFKQLKKE